VILRRLTVHLRTQNWFAVGLDLLVVVVGIYVGLQADAWMSSQRDRDLEQEYLQRLLADMELTVNAHREHIAEFEIAINAMDYLADRMRAGTLDDADPEKIGLAIDSLGWVPMPVTNMTTIRELQSTGNISLIQDVQIREAIGVEDLSTAMAEFSTSQNLSLISTAMPDISSWVFISPESKIGEFQASLDENEYGAVLEPDYELMLADPSAANTVSWISGWSKYHASIMLQHQNQTLVLRDLLLERTQMQPNNTAP